MFSNRGQGRAVGDETNKLTYVAQTIQDGIIVDCKNDSCTFWSNTVFAAKNHQMVNERKPCTLCHFMGSIANSVEMGSQRFEQTFPL